MKKKPAALLKKMTEGLMYFSEYEYPVSMLNMPVHSWEEVVPFICTYKNASPVQVKEIPVENFFHRFKIYLQTGGNDTLTLENAKRFIEIQNFLLESCKRVKVYRIEKDVQIPILIIGEWADRQLMGIETISMET